MLTTLFRSFLTSGMWLQRGGAIILVLLAVIAGADYKLKGAKTAYALAVLEINLRGFEDDKQIYAAVAQWKKDSWGAQLGALRVVCETDAAMLEVFGSRDMTLTLCRLVR